MSWAAAVRPYDEQLGFSRRRSASAHIIQEVDRLRNLATDLDWLAETNQGELRLIHEAISIHELLTVEVDRWQTQSQARQDCRW